MLPKYGYIANKMVFGLIVETGFELLNSNRVFQTEHRNHSMPGASAKASTGSPSCTDFSLAGYGESQVARSKLP